MPPRRFRVPLSLVGSLTAAAALLGLGLLSWHIWLAGFPAAMSPARPLFHALFPSLLVIALAVLVVICRRMRQAKASEARLRGILDSALDGIAIMDRDGRIVLANSQAGTILGYDGHELTGRSMQSLVTGPLPADTPSPTGKPSSGLNLAARHRDGRSIPVEVRLCSQQTEDGLFVTGIIRDLSERQHTERALHLRDHAMEAISQGIFITDAARPDHPIMYVNPAFERITGHPAGEVLGRQWTVLQGAGSSPATAAGVAVAMDEGRSYLVETLSYRKDGTTFWCTLALAPIRDPEGKVSHFVGVLTDVSEQKRLEAQLRQAQKMEAVGRLAGGIAHDFNNLLTVIIGHSDLLLGDKTMGADTRGSVEEINKAGDRAAALTRQLLAFSRKQVLAPMVVNLNSLVADLNRMLRRLIGEDIELTTLLEAALRPVKVDPGQVNQVLMNLTVNARDAMPGGGKLTIRTANLDLTAVDPSRPELPRGPYVLLEVSDTGCGMDEVTRAHLFEPFFTTKEQGKGTGLGLATVYGIVKQSGGYIYVESEPGCGSTFTIYLPGVAEEPPAEQTWTTVPEAPRRVETVLLIEDDLAVRSVARLVLQHNGYTVLEAGHGADALRISAQHKGPIHLLVTDVVMPQMGGAELAQRLVSSRPELKVLFISGYTDDAVIRHGVLSADVAFLQKPFLADHLANKVREILDQPAGAAAARDRLPRTSSSGHRLVARARHVPNCARG